MMKTKLFLFIVTALVFLSGCSRAEIKPDYSPPFIIDSHMHYTATDEWEKSFLDVFTRHNAMACLLMPMKDLDRGIAFAKAHPERVIPYAEINIDSPTVVEEYSKSPFNGIQGIRRTFCHGKKGLQ